MENFQYFKYSTLKDSACIGCGATVRVGYSGGWRVVLNPDPITIEQEIEELKAKRQTYWLYSTAVGDEAVYRTVLDISSNKKKEVLATHKCTRKQS